MKQQLLLLLLLLPFVGRSQQLNTEAQILCSGGGLLGNPGHEGHATLGLPFAGIFDAGAYATKLGLYSEQDTIQGSVNILAAKDKALTVYPNPSSGSFTVTLPEEEAHWTFFLYDEKGAKIQSVRPIKEGASGRAEFDLIKLSRGNYLFEVRSRTTSIIYKLVIK